MTQFVGDKTSGHMLNLFLTRVLVMGKYWVAVVRRRPRSAAVALYTSLLNHSISGVKKWDFVSFLHLVMNN